MAMKIIVLSIAIIAAFTMLKWLSLDTFTTLWQEAFVIAVKAAIFAMIPGGFLLAIYLRLTGD